MNLCYTKKIIQRIPYSERKSQWWENIKCIMKSPILEFPQTCGLHRIIENNIIHHLNVIPANINDSILIKAQNTSFGTIIVLFGPNFILSLAQNAKFWNTANILQTCFV